MNEELITFKQFSHQDAFNFGLRALKIVNGLATHKRELRRLERI